MGERVNTAALIPRLARAAMGNIAAPDNVTNGARPTTNGTRSRNRRRRGYGGGMEPIVPACAQDRDAVVALWRACGLTRPWNVPEADFATALATSEATVLVARHGAAVTGSVMAGFDGHRGWVYYLAVAPERRRAGLGRALMAAAEEFLRDRGAPKIQLMVRGDNAAAIGFYEALGLARQDVVTLGRFLERGER